MISKIFQIALSLITLRLVVSLLVSLLVWIYEPLVSRATSFMTLDKSVKHSGKCGMIDLIKKSIKKTTLSV